MAAKVLFLLSYFLTKFVYCKFGHELLNFTFHQNLNEIFRACFEKRHISISPLILVFTDNLKTDIFGSLAIKSFYTLGLHLN